MKFSAAIATAALFAGALAVPAADDYSGRAARRRAVREARRAGTLIKDIDGDFEAASKASSNDSNVSYSTNWSGAVLTSPPSGETFQVVVGTFTVPTPSVPSSGSSRKYSASAWVGIDGDTYSAAILQSGVDFTVTSSGSVSYDSWYEWYPDYAYDFSSFSVSAGDVITITIDATTDAKGTVTLDNTTTGKSVSKTLTAPDSSSDLGGENAEWIVEDYESGSSLVSLADWGSVTFTDASATTDEGTSVGLDDAEVIDIRQSGTVYTSVTINSDSSVTIEYIA